MPLSRSLPGRPAPGRLLLGAAVPWWRRSRRRTGRWLLTLGLAVVAGGIVSAQVDDAARTVAGLGRTRTVLVARRDLAPGHLLGDGDLVARELPVDAVPDSSVDGSVAEGTIDGRTVTAAIVAGEVVSSQRLAPDGVDGLAALVPVGRRAIAIPTTGTGLRVEVGDRVDVLDPSDEPAYGSDSPDRAASSRSAGVVATDALVIAVDDAAVTLAIEHDDAPTVARALATGTPVLALTGAGPDH